MSMVVDVGLALMLLLCIPVRLVGVRLGRMVVFMPVGCSEVAVYGLTGEIVGPLSKGAGVSVSQEACPFRVQPPT